MSADELATLQAKAAGGDTRAQIDLGWAYYRGDDVPINEEEGLRLLRAAAEKDNSEAKLRVGQILVRRRDPAGFDLLCSLRDLDYPPAFLIIGFYYYDGKLVDRDLDVALSHWVRGAELGHLLCKGRRDMLLFYRAHANPLKRVFWLFRALFYFSSYIVNFGLRRDDPRVLGFSEKFMPEDL